MSRRVIVLLLSAAAIFALGVLSRPALAHVASGLVTRLKPQPANAAPYDMLRYARKSSQFRTLTAKAKIVFLGDSRFEDAQWSELLERCDVANRGIDGDTTNGMVERMRLSVPNEGVTCVIQAGINDLSKGASVDAVIANYGRILDYLLADRHARVVVTSVILSGREYGSLNAKLTHLNRALAQLASSRGVVWLDLNQALCPDGFLPADYSNDGVHLNGPAYARLGSVLVPVLGATPP